MRFDTPKKVRILNQGDQSMKKLLSILLSLALVVTPLGSVLAFANDGIALANTIKPMITVNIDNHQYVTPDSIINISYSPKGGDSLVLSETRLEGKVISTNPNFSFTVSDYVNYFGSYTLVMQAKDSSGNTAYEFRTFIYTAETDITFTYAEDESIVPTDPDATAKYHEVEPLEFKMGYGSTNDGTVALDDVIAYDDYTAYAMKYWNEAVNLNSVSGIPYQTFDVALNGKTDGEVVIRYTGSTYAGERVAVKVYNPSTDAWDTLGTFMGSDSLSEAVDVATYADNDVIHVMAMLDYVTNGSNTIIWSTDPQHYTKFADLNDYYYTVYKYAAEQYVAGNAGYIITTGDLVDDLPNTSLAIEQWKIADKAMAYLEEVGMPNGLVAGNHDVGTFKKPDYTSGDATVNYSKFLEYFSAERYNDKAWYGGSLNNNISHYDLITVGNVDFVVLYLGYGVEATEETIAWANSVLQTYSHRVAVIATHEYLKATTADRSTASRAQLIYDKIVNPNPNVKLVLCGHDDGSILLERTASDGRTVYEILSDYQFVEAEDDSFYKNEHYIGSVPECCGDGYIRLMTIEGNTLSSITYSPITGRYNPYGDRESFSIDLGDTTPSRELVTAGFSAYVLGEEITLEETYTKPSVIVITKKASSAEDEDSATVNKPATPENPYYAHAADRAPKVKYKSDILSAAGLTNGAVVTAWTQYQNINLNVDLKKTPYLYYSVSVPENANFTFAFYNNANYSPWLVFRDASGEGAYLNNGAANWDAYTEREQFITASETGCIDMRTISTDPNKATWIVTHLSFYNSTGIGATVNYMFFGSEPIETATANKPATPENPYYTHATALAPTVKYKSDVLSAAGLTDDTVVTAWTQYQNINLNVDLKKTPYLYYSVSVPENANFTFSLYNNANYSPWLVFRDASGEGAYLNNGAANWDAYTEREQFITASETGCIDMRTISTDPNKATWIVTHLSFYNSTGIGATVNYMFFGSEPVETAADVFVDSTTYHHVSYIHYPAIPNAGDNVNVDLAPLTALIAKAEAINTLPYTADSVSALKLAIQNAKASTYVESAYIALANAIGALEKEKKVIDPATLKSVYKYTMTTANWTTSDVAMTQIGSSGIYMDRAASNTNDWASARYTGGSFNIKPVNGKIYMNLDIDANSSWCIYIDASQSNASHSLRMNFAIDNAFNRIEADSCNGHYSGVYDVTEAFVAAGLDLTSTITVTTTYLYIVPGDVTYYHIEYMTDKTAGSTDLTEINSVIASAYSLDKSLYTSASWSKLETAFANANSVINNSSALQADIDLAALELRKAIDNLKLLADVTPEPEGSLLPADESEWVPLAADTMKIYRDDSKFTVFRNLNGQWPCADYVLEVPVKVNTAEKQISLDITVAGQTNILLNINGSWISLTPYISNNLDAGSGDLLAGTYTCDIPFSELVSAETATITTVRIYAVGGAGAASAVTVRKLMITDLESEPDSKPEYLTGDVNGDGKVNMFDYMMVKSCYLNKSELTDEQIARADLTGDGKVNMFDYIQTKAIVLSK